LDQGNGLETGDVVGIIIKLIFYSCFELVFGKPL
jgi:hypothetical protein